MARVRRLAPYIWRAQWRVLTGKGRARAGNLVFVAVMGVMTCLVLAGVDAVAIGFLRRDLLDPARAGVAMVLGVAAAGLFLVPMFSQAAGVAGEGVTASRFVRFPITHGGLLGILGVARLFHPVYWALTLVAVTALVPIASAPRPIVGAIGALAFLSSAALGGLALQLAAGAVVTSRRANVVGRVLGAVLAVALYVAVVSVKLVHHEDTFVIRLWDHERLLIDAAGREGLLLSLRGWSPASLAARAAIDGDVILGVLPFAALTLACAALARWSLRRSLVVPEIGRASPGRGMRLPLPLVQPRTAALVRKEIAYAFRNHDLYVSLLAAWGAAAYYAIRGAPEWAVWLAIGYAVLVLSPAQFNAFGFDRAGVARYFLLPVTGEDVLRAKNLTVAIQLGAMLLPGIAVIAIGAGPVPALGVVATAAYMLMSAATLANAFSIRNPVPRRFGAFGGERYASSFALSMLFLVIIGVPIGLHVLLGAWSPIAAVVVEWGLAALVALAYRRSLRSAGALFDRSAASLCERLSD